MNIVIIVQARMTSTRLPGKVLKEVLGKALLEYQIERLKRVQLADDIVIATTKKATDDPIVNLCNKLSVSFFRGSEEDVLARYYEAAIKYHADIIVRITSDCPLVDPDVVDNVIKTFIDNYRLDYVSNRLELSFPRGMDVEVFSIKALKEAFVEGVLPPDREHVTPFIYRHPERYEMVNVKNYEDQSRHRWTVDTEEDFQLIKNIIEAIYPSKCFFGLEDIIRLIDCNPEWFFINSHIKQKELEY